MQYQNPYMPYQGGYQYPQFNSQPAPQNNLLRVSGPESAKAYRVGPNSSVVLFDGDQPLFYLKTTDDSGFARVRTFRFEEVADSGNEQPDVGSELEELKGQIAEMQKTLKELV